MALSPDGLNLAFAGKDRYVYYIAIGECFLVLCLHCGNPRVKGSSRRATPEVKSGAKEKEQSLNTVIKGVEPTWFGPSRCFFCW